MVDWPKPIPITLAIMAGLWALLVVLAAPLPAGLLNGTQSTTRGTLGPPGRLRSVIVA